MRPLGRGLIQPLLWPYKKRNLDTQRHLFSVSAQRKVWEDADRKVAILKLRREASGEIKTEDTLILDFQPPELWDNKFLSFLKT